LHLEPGRSLIARAGVALYRVGAVKKRGGRTWLLTDGGMTDNPRHALYGSRYSALPVSDLEREWSELVHIAGPFWNQVIFRSRIYHAKIQEVS
jgi:diaminopimelate decarboxylase